MGFKNLAKILFIGGLLIILTCTNIAQAGFGISPPKVLNQHLLPGSHFEQTIYLVQSKPDKDLVATLEIDAPEIKNWIIIENGLQFTIPAGVQAFPMKVIVDVPVKAEFKDYSGQIWLKTRAKTAEEGMVTVALGALITLDLRVSAEEVYGFILQGLEIPKLEEGWPIKVVVSLRNTGNAKDRPTKIHLTVYDQYHGKNLQSGEVSDLNYVEPFKTGDVVGKFPTKLGVGTYWGDITVLKGDDVLIEDKRVFYIVEKGSLSKGLGWFGWTLIGIAILAGLFVLRYWYRRTHQEGIFTKVINKLRFWKRARVMRKRSKLERKLRKLGRF